jgi:hypothetical protein
MSVRHKTTSGVIAMGFDAVTRPDHRFQTLLIDAVKKPA